MENPSWVNPHHVFLTLSHCTLPTTTMFSYSQQARPSYRRTKGRACGLTAQKQTGKTQSWDRERVSFFEVLGVCALDLWGKRKDLGQFSLPDMAAHSTVFSHCDVGSDLMWTWLSRDSDFWLIKRIEKILVKSPFQGAFRLQSVIYSNTLKIGLYQCKTSYPVNQLAHFYILGRNKIL